MKLKTCEVGGNVFQEMSEARSKIEATHIPRTILNGAGVRGDPPSAVMKAGDKGKEGLRSFPRPTVSREKVLEPAFERRSANSASLEPSRAPDQLWRQKNCPRRPWLGVPQLWARQQPGKSGAPVRWRRSVWTAALDTGASQSRGNESTERHSACAGLPIPPQRAHVTFRSDNMKFLDDVVVTNLDEDPTESTEEQSERNCARVRKSSGNRSRMWSQC